MFHKEARQFLLVLLGVGIFQLFHSSSGAASRANQVGREVAHWPIVHIGREYADHLLGSHGQSLEFADGHVFTVLCPRTLNAGICSRAYLERMIGKGVDDVFVAEIIAFRGKFCRLIFCFVNIGGFVEDICRFYVMIFNELTLPLVELK